MKILISTDNLAPYRVAWAEELGKVHDVTMVYYKSHDLERNDEWLIKASQMVKLVKLRAVIVGNRAISFQFKKYYKKMNPEIVIFDGYGIMPNLMGIFYLNLHKKHFYVNIDGVLLDEKNNPVKSFIKKKIFSPSATLLCSSEFTMKYLKKYGAQEKNMVTHGFSSVHDSEILEKVPTKEQRNEKKRELGLAEKDMILAVGRFLDWKKFDMLIEAVSMLKQDCQLVLVGEGAEKETYEKLIAKFSLGNVRILDFMSIDRLKEYYFAADVFVLPSSPEVWGLVLNEAMAYGALPVISSNRCVGGQSLIKEGENGQRFQYDSVQGLQEAIEEVLEDENKRVSMGDESLKIVRNYTIEGMARKHLQCFAMRKTKI